MKFRIFRRLCAFAITASVIAVFGFLCGFLYSVWISARFIPVQVDYAAADTAAVDSFFASDAKILRLSSNDLAVFINEIYYRGMPNDTDIALPMPPELSLEDGLLKLGVAVSVPILASFKQAQMNFYGDFDGKHFNLKAASLGDARMPLWIAGSLLSKIGADYMAVKPVSEYYAKFSSLSDIKIEANKLVLVK